MPVVEVLDGRVCRLGEGPFYDERSRRMVWVDILGRRILWRSLGTGETGELSTAEHVGAAVPREGGGLVLCLPDGPALLDPDGTLRPLGSFVDADVAAGRPPSPAGPKVRANDAKADPRGRLWLGTMAYDETPGAGALYRLDPGATAPVRVVDGVTISNGLGWSPDGGTMYYIDTPTRQIDAFAYHLSTGDLGERRVFAELPRDTGFPDGACVDADGALWVAFWGGGAVRRFTPDGAVDRVVEVGTPLVTSCAFAGDDFDLLVITTAAGSDGRSAPGAGLTYADRPDGIFGRPVDRFAG